MRAPPQKKWSGQHLILWCLSPFGVLRGTFCQPCHLMCFRVLQSPASPPAQRRVSVQTLPVGSPFQEVVMTAQLHINPKISLERLVSLNLTAWKLLPNISCWVLQIIEKGYQYSSGLARPGLWGCFPPR